LEEYDGVLVVVDRFPKMTCYIPVTMNITLKKVGKNLWEQVFKDTGLFRKVISNRGLYFVSNFMKKLCNQLGIE